MLFQRFFGLLTALLFCSVIAMAQADDKHELKTDTEEPQADESRLPLEELRNYAQVFEQIRNAYVEEVDDKTLLKNSIIGMLSQLDPHSAYLDESTFEDLQTNTQGEFGGLGIEVGMEDGFVKVISPIDDTPAQKAGVMAGDLIVKLDGTPVKGMGLNQAIEKMRGKKGTKILLTIVRKGIDKPIEMIIVRDMIKVVSVRVEKMEEQFAYVRIAQFQVNTAEDLKKLLGKMKGEMAGALQGIVLDLRNNPGGVLQGAVDVADVFLERGLVVYTEGRIQNANMRFEATAGDMLNGAPIVVLINEGSASASEIVAGALQDQKRAIVVGMKSFGKGSVQTVLPLSEKRAIKLTTARYYTPSGRSIQAAGIVPDIEVIPAVLETMKAVDRVTESDLDGHLSNNKDNKEVLKNEAADTLSAWLQKDNQLHDAFGILKALTIQRQSQADLMERPQSPPSAEPVE
jgi:carboxyl-terminal processing protease